MRIAGRWRFKRCSHEFRVSFFDFNAMARRQILENLLQTIWPGNARAQCPLKFSNAEEELLGMLRQKSRSRLQIFRLALRSGVDGHRGPDRVAIAFLAMQTERHRTADLYHGVVQNTQLRRIAIL